MNSPITRPKFMTPKPVNVKTEIPSILSKRKYEDAFDLENYDDERYGQHIDSDYFTHIVSNGVYQPEPEQPKSRCQEAADAAIADLNQAISPAKLLALGITCDSVDEMVAWCELWLKLSGK